MLLRSVPDKWRRDERKDLVSMSKLSTEYERWRQDRLSWKKTPRSEMSDQVNDSGLPCELS